MGSEKIVCDHDTITADVLESDCDDVCVQWCQRCGSYRRGYMLPTSRGWNYSEWTEPENVKTEVPEFGWRPHLNGERIRQLERLVDRHAAEVNRRRGEMAVARETLDELGVPKTKDGSTLTFRERILLLAKMPRHPND